MTLETLHLSCILQSRLLDIPCLTETWLVETLSDNTYLTAACSVIASVERIANQHGCVAVLGKNGFQAIKVEGYECSFLLRHITRKVWSCSTLSPPITSEYRIPEELVFNCLSSFSELFCRQHIDRVLFMGDFNLPDEDWANFPAIDAETLTSTMDFSTTNSFTQLFTEPTHKDGNVFDLIFSNFNDYEFLCIEKHLSFSDHYSVSPSLPRTKLALSVNTDCRPFSLIASDIQALDLELSKSLFSFDLLQFS